jgi:hypothetical protein
MPIKVFIEQINQNERQQFQEGGDHEMAPHDAASDQQRPNVSVRVKNTDTLDEYRGESYCNPQFL